MCAALKLLTGGLLACFFGAHVCSGVRILRKPPQTRAPATAGGRNAIVSLFYGASSLNLLSLRTSMHSARRHGSKADRIAMIPRGDPALAYRSLLESDGIEVVEVPAWAVPQGMRGIANQSHWSLIMTKFMAFNLTAYSKVLLVDFDAVFTGGPGNPDDIFEDCGVHELCLVEDQFPDNYIAQDCPDDPALCSQLNTGVMVLSPSAQRLSDIWQEAEKDNHSYHWPDQQFFSRYLNSARRQGSMSFKLLGIHWNNCGFDPPADPEARLWVAHLCGKWVSIQSQFCTEKPGCPPKLRAWQMEAIAMDPCLSQKTRIECGSSVSCGWCEGNSEGTEFCMDRRMDCTNITFHLKPHIDAKENQ